MESFYYKLDRVAKELFGVSAEFQYARCINRCSCHRIVYEGKIVSKVWFREHKPKTRLRDTFLYAGEAIGSVSRDEILNKLRAEGIYG